MSLETYTGFIKDLVTTNPQGTDPKSQGDDHLRGIKQTLATQFSGFTEGVAVTVKESEVNKLAGITGSIVTTTAGKATSAAVADMSKQVPAVVFGGGNLVASHTGNCVQTSGSVNVPAGVFSAGDVVSIYNYTGTTMNIVPLSGFSLILSGSTASTTRTLPINGIATIWFRDSAVGIISGSGVV
jgi:hypothetical protein